MSDKTLHEKLLAVQIELKAPKNQFNKFGNYPYRSCEDILEAVKPLLQKNELLMTISDTMKSVGDRIYVEAKVTLMDIKQGHALQTIEVTASAREALTQKGMNDSQLTGSTSSYARKYALNGMYAIDDTKDSDATNTHGKEAKSTPKPESPKPLTADEMIAKINEAKATPHLKNIWTKYAPDFNFMTESDQTKVKQAKEVKKAELVGAI